MPARPGHRLPLKRLTGIQLLCSECACNVEACVCGPSSSGFSAQTPAAADVQLSIYVQDDSATADALTSTTSFGHGRLGLRVAGPTPTLQDFGKTLELLLRSRDVEGESILDFISRRLFQYLWVRQESLRSEEEIYEAQAVLAFNLDPKDGVAYLQRKLGRSSDADVGEWLAHMASHKGGVDPTQLGTYFSRLGSIDVARSFISRLDLGSLDVVSALRKLFDKFKPGGESQVITRILEFFAETYFSQWDYHRSEVTPEVFYKNSDSVLQAAVSIIMLNTGLHIVPRAHAPRRNRKGLAAACLGIRAAPTPNRRGAAAAMTLEEYVRNTRLVVGSDEVPDEALCLWYQAVRDNEISVEPLPRVPFSTLPVQPDIEGWLVAVLGSRVRRRVWAVLALRRLYLFSDADEMDPTDTLDLKDVGVRLLADDAVSRKRLCAELRGSTLRGMGACLEVVPEDLPELVLRGFVLQRELGDGKLELKGTLGAKPLQQIVLVAEASDLAEKWVMLISSGPY